jgi:glycosyltransferase involved in cell wall biosynthesis
MLTNLISPSPLFMISYILIKKFKVNKVYTLNAYPKKYWEKKYNVKFITPFMGGLFTNKYIYFLFYPLACFLMYTIKVKEKNVIFYTSSAGIYCRSISSKKILYLNYPSRGIYETTRLFRNKFISFIFSIFIKLTCIKYFEKKAYSKFTKILTISKDASDALDKYLNLKSSILNPPTSLNINLKRKSINTIDTKFLLVSRLEPEKGVEPVLDYFNDSGKYLTVVGSGSLSKYFKIKYNSKNIEYTDFISEDKLIETYHNSDCLIFPSQIEYGLCILEALHSGAPVLAIKTSFTSLIKKTTKNKNNILYFKDLSKNEIENVLNKFANENWDPIYISNSIKEFGQDSFYVNFKNYLN